MEKVKTLGPIAKELRKVPQRYRSWEELKRNAMRLLSEKWYGISNLDELTESAKEFIESKINYVNGLINDTEKPVLDEAVAEKEPAELASEVLVSYSRDLPDISNIEEEEDDGPKF